MKMLLGSTSELRPSAASLSSDPYIIFKWGKFTADKCIDGIINYKQRDEYDLCQTEEQLAPWLSLDFGEKAKVAVERVFLYSRHDNYYHRTRNVTIRISDELPTTGEEEFTGGELLGTFEGPATRKQTVKIVSKEGWERKFGRFLVIQMNVGNEKKTWLNLKEVKAFGRKRLKSDDLNTPPEEPVCKSNSDCKDGGQICHGGKCLPGCGRNKDCKEEENCQDGSCVNICNPPNAQDGKSPPKPCGTNALCKSTKHRKECSCPPNHLGNPEDQCITEKKGRLKLVEPA